MNTQPENITVCSEKIDNLNVQMNKDKDGDKDDHQDSELPFKLTACDLKIGGQEVNNISKISVDRKKDEYNITVTSLKPSILSGFAIHTPGVYNIIPKMCNNPIETKDKDNDKDKNKDKNKGKNKKDSSLSRFLVGNDLLPNKEHPQEYIESSGLIFNKIGNVWDYRDVFMTLDLTKPFRLVVTNFGCFCIFQNNVEWYSSPGGDMNSNCTVLIAYKFLEFQITFQPIDKNSNQNQNLNYAPKQDIYKGLTGMEYLKTLVSNKNRQSCKSETFVFWYSIKRIMNLYLYEVCSLRNCIEMITSLRDVFRFNPVKLNSIDIDDYLYRATAFFAYWIFGLDKSDTIFAENNWDDYSGQFNGVNYIDKLLLSAENEKRTKLVIILVGIPGSGKTTLGKLFAAKYGGIYIDQDECSAGKSNQNAYHAAIEDAIYEGRTPIVLGKCHHTKKIRDLVRDLIPYSVNTVLVDFNHPVSIDEYVKLCYNRIQERGDNHPNLFASNTKLSSIISGFVKSMDPISDEEKKLSIYLPLDITKSVTEWELDIFSVSSKYIDNICYVDTGNVGNVGNIGNVGNVDNNDTNTTNTQDISNNILNNPTNIETQNNVEETSKLTEKDGKDGRGVKTENGKDKKDKDHKDNKNKKALYYAIKFSGVDIKPILENEYVVSGLKHNKDLIVQQEFHVTMEFFGRSGTVVRERPYKQLVGRGEQIRCLGVFCDEFGMAILVDSTFVHSNKYAHITIANKKGTPPVYSNKLIERNVLNGKEHMIMFDKPIFLNGTVHCIV